MTTTKTPRTKMTFQMTTTNSAGSKTGNAPTIFSVLVKHQTRHSPLPTLEKYSCQDRSATKCTHISSKEKSFQSQNNALNGSASQNRHIDLNTLVCKRIDKRSTVGKCGFLSYLKQLILKGRFKNLSSAVRTTLQQFLVSL